MAIVSHLHHLFSAETCQSYIHTLRWKDRPLQCPRCQSHNVGPWGTYHAQPVLKRYRCKEKACKRTFNDLAQFIAVCRASILAEKRRMPSPLSSQFLENKGALLRP
jgi:hypothetical protein